MFLEAHTSHKRYSVYCSPIFPTIAGNHFLDRGDRNLRAIVHWCSVEWPKLHKKAVKTRRTVVFMYEAGFLLLSGLVHTYAPRGQLPILDVPFGGDHLSVLGAVTLDSMLLTWIQGHSMKGGYVFRGWRKGRLNGINGRYAT
jgi:hypothetical protein